MYETLEHWKQYKQKKYQQCQAEKPGAMILDEMKEAEELQAKIAKQFKLDEAIKEVNKKKNFEEFDKWFNKLLKKNGTTKY